MKNFPMSYSFRIFKRPQNIMLKTRIPLTLRFIDTSSLRPLILKIPVDPETITNVPTKPTPEETNIPDTSLTPEEIEFIRSSSFVQSLPPQESTLERDLPPKVQAVAEHIPITKDGFLTYRRPKTIPTPFKFYTTQLPDEPEHPTSMGHTHTSVYDFPRLSVTKILTQSWCELRDWFEIYSKSPRVETAAMKRGKELHLELELETHPEIDMTAVQTHIPAYKLSKEDSYVEGVVDTTMRLINLLQHGRAREVYVHGFIDEQGIVDEAEKVFDETIIVTGVIDHLVLLSNDTSRPLENAFRKYDDIKELIDDGATILDDFEKNYRLVVSDIKTRSKPLVPTQESVLKAAKDQVMIYHDFLNILGREIGIDWLIEYCRRKAIDIDEPISPEFALGLIHTYPILHKDFERLRDGHHIGDDNFDAFAVPTDCYDLSNLKDQITDEEMLSTVGTFLTKWRTAPTTRYFLTRISMLFHYVSVLSKGDLRVEYRHQQSAFHTMKFEYDEESARDASKKGIEFWKGIRDPRPVEGSYRNMDGICRYCDFKDNCLWNKEVIERNFNRALN